jgi:hypothetical protein
MAICRPTIFTFNGVQLYNRASTKNMLDPSFEKWTLNVPSEGALSLKKYCQMLTDRSKAICKQVIYTERIFGPDLVLHQARQTLRELINLTGLYKVRPHFHLSLNKIMFVWNVRKWKPIFVDATETTEDDVTTLTHVPTKWWRVRYRNLFRAKLPY